jgi:hypothetical protein
MARWTRTPQPAAKATLSSPSTPTLDAIDYDNMTLFESPGPAKMDEDVALPYAVPFKNNDFIEQHRESIQPAIRLIEHHNIRRTWCGVSFKVYPPA